MIFCPRHWRLFAFLWIMPRQFLLQPLYANKAGSGCSALGPMFQSMKCKEHIALWAVAFQPTGRLYLCSHSFLLPGSFSTFGNLAPPLTSVVLFLLIFLASDVQSATAHTILGKLSSNWKVTLTLFWEAFVYLYPGSLSNSARFDASYVCQTGAFFISLYISIYWTWQWDVIFWDNLRWNI